MQLGILYALLFVLITLEVDHVVHVGEGAGVAAKLSTQTLPAGWPHVWDWKLNVRPYHRCRARTA